LLLILNLVNVEFQKIFRHVRYITINGFTQFNLFFCISKEKYGIGLEYQFCFIEKIRIALIVKKMIFLYIKMFVEPWETFQFDC